MVLPLLDAFVFEHTVWYQDIGSTGYGADIHALCRYDALHLWRKVADNLHQPQRYESLCGTYEGDAYFCILPAVGAAGATVGIDFALVPGDSDWNRRCGAPVMVG